ncbi:MRN complex-interacting protein isoform X2 [Desmodus rotundus]|uniref:MRN complex-interacting protein isoform X2 n=1 Tax=Desmodus rotundus TaxID=9430 RepID=UPI002380D9F2|nr:MRN complex-interacting protein isoform X2 [Desmodus rotundus]
MEPPAQARVLRCCCCRVFQAHQVKKSLKWTCRVRGEQQSFLRAYGEGSGADCRRHVQKLNLLQARLSEMPHRSLEEPARAGRERNAGPGPAQHVSAQEEPRPSGNRWRKYLERGSGELGLLGAECFSSWSSSAAGQPDAPSGTSLPRKRRWSQSAVQPPHSPAGQDVGDSEVTLEMQKGHAGLAGKLRASSRKAWDAGQSPGPAGTPQCAAQQVGATSSKWVQVLAPPGNSAHMATEPSAPLERSTVLAGAAQAEQGTPWAQPTRDGGLSRTPSALQLLWATHTPTCGPKGLLRVTPEQLRGTGPQAESGPLVRRAQAPQLTQLQDLFSTGEDFDDDL